MTHSQSLRSRRGLTLVEVVVALAIVGGVMIGLGMFTVNLSRSNSASRLRIAAAQLVSQRLETVKGASRYTAIESLYVATETNIIGSPGYTRQTWVLRTGGQPSDTIDYKTVTVQVTNPQMSGNMRKTTVIAPF